MVCNEEFIPISWQLPSSEVVRLVIHIHHELLKHEHGGHLVGIHNLLGRDSCYCSLPQASADQTEARGRQGGGGWHWEMKLPGKTGTDQFTCDVVVLKT